MPMLIRGHTLLYMRYFVHIHHTYIRYTYYLPSTHTYTLQSCCCARGGFRWSAPPGMDRFTTSLSQGVKKRDPIWQRA